MLNVSLLFFSFLEQIFSQKVGETRLSRPELFYVFEHLLEVNQIRMRLLVIVAKLSDRLRVVGQDLVYTQNLFEVSLWNQTIIIVIHFLEQIQTI